MPECGELLRQARLARGWSLDELHIKARISVNALMLIEEERWSELPEDAILRGYVKRFAQFVGFDGDEIWTMVEAARGGVKQPQPAMVASPRSPETGTVRLVTKERPAPDLLGAEAISVEDSLDADSLKKEEVQEDLRVIAAHVLNEVKPPRSKRGSTSPRSRQSTSVSALGQDGQLPLINSRSEPGSRSKTASDQLRPVVSHNLLDENDGEKDGTRDGKKKEEEKDGELEALGRRETKQAPISEAEAKVSTPAQIAQRSVVSFLDDSSGNAGIAEMKRRQAVNMQRKRLLKVRRRRLLVTIAFWMAAIAVSIYALFFYENGRIWQQILTSLSIM